MTFEKSYQSFTGNQLNLYIDKSHKEQYETEIFMDIDLKHYPLRDFKNIYISMSNIIQDYDKLNQRNKKKDELHLLKHAMHLIRLLIMGTDILQSKGICTYRKYDQELLLDIRNGNYSYEQIFKMADDYNKQFMQAAHTTTLPQEPDYNGVQELLITIYKRRFC